MTSRNYIKIVGGHRSPHKNEFFFTQNPFNDAGMRELFDYLEKKYNFHFEKIDDWQIQNTVSDTNGRYLPAPHGLRVNDND